MMKSNRKTFLIVDRIFSHLFLIILSAVWVLPIFWIILTAFRAESGAFTSYFFPKGYTFSNFINLFAENQLFKFGLWFRNTFIVAVATCLLSSFYVLSISYTMSRLRFKMRKKLMNIALILGMFPGFMSMIAVYYILKAVGLTQSLIALVLVYSGGAGLGFYVVKGFFDIIPKSLDEAARIDGASRFKIFTAIILPLSKSIIVYTLLTSFLAPWMDFIFVSVIMGDNYDKYTVALGLYRMLELEFINTYFTRFAAGAVLVSIPITALFISLRKFYVAGATSGAVKG